MQWKPSWKVFLQKWFLTENTSEWWNFRIASLEKMGEWLFKICNSATWNPATYHVKCSLPSPHRCGREWAKCANKHHNVPPLTVDSQTSESYAHFSILWRQTMPKIFSSWAPPQPWSVSQKKSPEWFKQSAPPELKTFFLFLLMRLCSKSWKLQIWICFHKMTQPFQDQPLGLCPWPSTRMSRQDVEPPNLVRDLKPNRIWRFWWEVRFGPLKIGEIQVFFLGGTLKWFEKLAKNNQKK